VGLLDERFVGYGFDDDDYSLRVRLAGLLVGIHDGCYCDHGSLKSSYRGEPKTAANLVENGRIFRQKWGAGNHDL
jgi:GT2 family glycosyltransferase